MTMMTTGKELINAIGQSDWDKVRHILKLENARELVEYATEDGFNAVHVACYRETPLSVLQSLLHVSSEAPLLKNENGETPLHLAIRNSRDDMIVMMIESWPETASIVDQDGWRALDCAIAFNKSARVVQSLLQAHPSVSKAPNMREEAILHCFFFHVWNLGLRNTLERLKGEEWCLMDAKVEKEDRGVRSMQEVHDITVLLLQAILYGRIEEGSVSFRPLYASIMVQHCPWSFCSMILKYDEEQAWVSDERGDLLLHSASETKSSFDGELYSCWECKAQFNHRSWYQHSQFQYRKYCQECFVKNEEVERDCYLMESVDKIPAIIEELIAVNSKAASCPNHEGRLPLSLAIEQGRTYVEGGVKTIFRAAPEALSTRDVKTHMYPFMQAAVIRVEKSERDEAEQSDKYLKQFTTVFSLLMENPVLVL